MLILRRAGEVGTSPFFLHPIPGYPQICNALGDLEVFVLKNNWKDFELLSLCSMRGVSSPLLFSGIVKGAQGNPSVLFYLVIYSEATAPTLMRFSRSVRKRRELRL